MGFLSLFLCYLLDLIVVLQIVVNFFIESAERGHLIVGAAGIFDVLLLLSLLLVFLDRLVELAELLSHPLRKSLVIDSSLDLQVSSCNKEVCENMENVHQHL